MPELIVLLILWLGCGAVAAGMVNAKHRQQLPVTGGLLSAALRENVIMGPVALFIVIMSQTGIFPPSFKDGPDA